MGQGVEAAAAMAQVRSTIRLRDRRPGPGPGARAVDRFYEALRTQPAGDGDLLAGRRRQPRVHIASAGHLPPLLIDEDGCHIVQSRTARRSASVSRARGP